MAYSEFDLAVGDVVVLGDQTLTVMDIGEDGVAFRVDPVANGSDTTEVYIAETGNTLRIKTPANPHYRRMAR